jgi:hypothetical protein
MTTETSSAANEVAPQRPAGLLRAVVLAGIGLIGLLGDELQAAYERGAQQQRGAQQRRQNAGVSRLVADEWEATLARLNLPTKSDIAQLTQQMTALEEQLDQIVAQRAAHRPVK